ncbi:NAD(P)/FAD-dependent oxidoreductase [Psychroserpens sp. XS_ASV72]|uniref:NAD(P)/FAD-dependent oxidoreductase n=1 Tax=Psychroserpens sp. XS_ASV72 TaxID=3241293 RepID=UPI0035187DDD
MKHVDYIVVGCGLAGIAFCERLYAHQKSFIVFDNASQQSSRVAAGLYNPVVLKRFTKVWNAKSQLELAMPKYKELEERLETTLNHNIPVYRRFTSIEEQNDWFTASDQPVLCDFLSTQIKSNSNPTINAEFGFGEVLHSGRINTTQLVKSYTDDLQKNNQYRHEAFQYDSLQIDEAEVSYKDLRSKYIVFAEGFGLKYNPFFSHLPLNGTKGEMLTIKAPELKMDFILKSSVFVVPLGHDLYWIGSTYEWDDKTHNTTEEAKQELIQKVQKVITCDFEVVDQVAGIRPTTKDRRPLVGVHSKYDQLFVLNGLGTRGVMISHYVAEQLFNFIENKLPLDEEIDINRFMD